MNDGVNSLCAQRRNVALAFLAICMMTIGGCTSPARFTPATGSENLPPYEGEVRVLENLPSSDQFTRVGVVIVEGVQLTRESDMVAAIKREAARRGADAVVMQGPIKSMKDASGGVQRTLAAWAIRLNR